MKRAMLAAMTLAAILVSATAAFAWSLSEDGGNAAHLRGPCDKCLGGVKPALSRSIWIDGATWMERQPDRSWLKIRVNDRPTDLGRVVILFKGELMAPVTSAPEFGLTATRSGLNHRLLTLAGGRYLVRLRIGAKGAEIGYAKRALPVAPMWYNGKVYMPLESIGKHLDWETSFNKAKGTLSINTRGPDVVSFGNAGSWAQARHLYDEALAEYQKAAALDPGDWTILGRMGDCQLAKAQYNDALAASHGAIKEALERVKEYKAYVEMHPRTGMTQYQEAVKRAVALVAQYEKIAATYYPLTDVRQPDQALDIYSRVLMTDPLSAKTPKIASTTLIVSDDLGQAIQQAAASQRECDTRANNAYRAAVAQYRAAAELAPATVTEFRSLAKANGMNDDPAEAAKAFRKALQIDPQYATVRLELAYSLADQGKYVEAIEEARRAIELDKTSAAAYNLLGYALRKEGQEKDAVAAYQKAIELDPKFALAYNNLGVAHRDARETEKALKMLAKAVALDGARADFQANYARALQDAKKLDEAVAAWKNAVALSPESVEYHAGLAVALFEAGDVDGALSEARLALARRDKSKSELAHAAADAQGVIAMALLEKGRMGEALTEAKTASEAIKDTAAGAAILAAVHVERLDPEAAMKALQAAPEAGRDALLYRAVDVAARALTGQATAQNVADVATLIGGSKDRWAWYFTARAYAALGLTGDAAAAFKKPQPDRYDPARRALVADYLARHGQDAKTAAAAAGPALKTDLNVMEIAGTDPVLVVCNHSGKSLSVLFNAGPGNEAVWEVASGVCQEGAFPAGIADYTLTLRSEGARDTTVTVKPAESRKYKLAVTPGM